MHAIDMRVWTDIIAQQFCHSIQHTTLTLDALISFPLPFNLVQELRVGEQNYALNLSRPSSSTSPSSSLCLGFGQSLLFCFQPLLNISLCVCWLAGKRNHAAHALFPQLLPIPFPMMQMGQPFTPVLPSKAYVLCAVLCCAVLCCAVLCCAVLCVCVCVCSSSCKDLLSLVLSFFSCLARTQVASVMRKGSVLRSRVQGGMAGSTSRTTSNRKVAHTPGTLKIANKDKSLARRQVCFSVYLFVCPLACLCAHVFVTHTHTHSLTHSLTLSLTPSLLHSLTHSLTHSLIHTHTHTFTYIHTLTHSLCATPPLKKNYSGKLCSNGYTVIITPLPPQPLSCADHTRAFSIVIIGSVCSARRRRHKWGRQCTEDKDARGV